MDELVARKREIFAWYKAELGAIDSLMMNAEPIGTKNTFWMVSVVPGPQYKASKAELMDSLARAGAAILMVSSELTELVQVPVTLPVAC